MKRRDFLIQGGLFSATTIATIGNHGWVARAANPHPQRLIVILLRGAVDGLNVVVPYREAAYYQARPQIAIPQPGQDNGAWDLDGQFGLHPSLSGLMPLWQNKTLAFVHACGSHDPTRSHFDAQQFLENGTPGNKRTQDGWMNRLLSAIANHSPIQAVSVGATIPWILSGRMPVANLASGVNASKPLAIDKPQIANRFDQLYSGNDSLSQTYREGKIARQTLMKNLADEMQAANNGAPLPYVFVGDAKRLAQLMVKDASIQLGFMALGGWDTHVNQGSTQGRLAGNLKQLGDGLAALVQGLGNLYQHTTIVVISEFGRTLRQNNNGGTDHGHGNVMWVLGGQTKGGKVYGEWPGLSTSQLYQQRDLAITTDFRDVIYLLLERHLNLETAKINRILPEYRLKQDIGLI
ncbi:hypothetical protein B6N60_02131 [Richelia sinica FACHB-800]|uniref:Twin-arginine translocation pathway signal n=1 Tax=Richelia sinica FACHB-800 TaxID=1357546 RepID=A0A975T8R2_9NOST|nr:DUF1501 domain-containing protein [Richelia sinica]MBD2666812.1 DUF1501 domain-containing protein [Richelia sinica FACHB-800]QXE23441.1 hypothetical protein B6N60_02131 [Richelia sinica FACHB-800]